ncbi:MAG: prepilin-type N-terminal cleavage/methylation domain-containing protein [Lentisphaerota bacterium]
MTFRKAKGFTLVEMLVVIAIIAILAAALFPQIQNAIDQARSTAMKQKGRGVWVGVVSANNEREVLSLGPVWPSELIAENTVPAPQKGTDYFAALLKAKWSDTAIATTPEGQLVSDAKADLFAGGSFNAAANGAVPTSANIAWRAFQASALSGGSDAFMVTKDFGNAASDCNTNTAITLAASGPFKGRRIVWVTVGGGTFDARKKYAADCSRLMGGTTNTISILGD